jgi:5-methylcytosine-specific restriction enzyme A
MADYLLTGRRVEEWIGKTPESKPPKAVIDRLFLKQMGRCAISGHKFRPGEVRAADHIVPLKDGGQNRETNLQLLTVDAHKEKTSAENAARAKEQRMRLKHHGLWPKSARPIQSRGFPKRSLKELPDV